MFSHNKIEIFEKEMPSSRWCLTHDRRGRGGGLLCFRRSTVELADVSMYPGTRVFQFPNWTAAGIHHLLQLHEQK